MMTPAAGSVELMHEASGESGASVEAAPVDGAPVERAPHDSAAPEPSGVGAIEALPLVERAPKYQAVADRLRAELERSDPSSGDLAR